jgi:ADP-glucose pyrophosphorylase
MPEILELSAQELDLLPEGFHSRKWHRHPLGGGLVEDSAEVHAQATVAKGAVVCNKDAKEGITRIGMGTVVYPGVRVQGCQIGDNVIIKADAKLMDSTVGNRVKIDPDTFIIDSTIADDTMVVTTLANTPNTVASSKIGRSASIQSSRVTETVVGENVVIKGSAMYASFIADGDHTYITNSHLSGSGVESGVQITNADIKDSHIGAHAVVRGASKDNRITILNDRIDERIDRISVDNFVTESRTGERPYSPPHLKDMRVSLTAGAGSVPPNLPGRDVAEDRAPSAGRV